MKRTNITLRTKPISKGRRALYLDFYPPILNPATGKYTRREFLKLYLFDKPKGFAEKLNNSESQRMAEIIYTRRLNEVNKQYIYTPFEIEQLRLKEIGQRSFLQYFREQREKRTGNNYEIWESAILHFERYINKDDILFKDINERAYLNTLHSLGLCYTKAGNYGKSETIVQTGQEEAARINNHSMDAYFLHLEGQNHYFGRDYDLAIRDLKKSVLGIEENDDYANVAVANFYIGKSYWALKKFREGLPYLQKVAEAFDQKEYIRPDLRENFELLIKYYKSKNEPRLVLHYVDELLKADSLLLKTHDDLYDNIHKNYDTKELTRNKQNIERQLSHELSNKRFLTIGAALLFIISTIVFIAYEKNRRRQNRIFKELINPNRKETPKPARNVAKELEIAQETIDKILRSLEKWEQSKRFLEKDITQTSLAVYMETNVRYLSDIILVYRGKKFSDYINDLKVEYIIEQLKSDRLKRMYTHEALAKEAGFSTTQRFVQAFKARTGISPNFFSAKIRKEISEINH